MDHNIYRYNISKYSDTININVEKFLNENERNFIWNQPRKSYIDSYNREATIFQIKLLSIKKFLEEKLKRVIENDFEFIVDNVSLLKLSEPTKPHIDGHYPFIYRNNKKYCVIKCLVSPIAFDTELDIDLVYSTLVLFKQHYNYYLKDGIEFDKILKDNIKYNDYDLEDSNCKPVKKHNRLFTKNVCEYSHLISDNKDLIRSLDIDKFYNMKLGDIVSMNPYQIHCTKSFQNFIKLKWVLRFDLAKKIAHE